MSDAAFKTASYPGYTTKELQHFIAEARAANDIDKETKLGAEIARRQKVANGDVSVMTQGERLRFARTGKGR